MKFGTLLLLLTPLVALLLLSVSLFLHGPRRREPGAIPLALLMIATGVWIAGDLLALASEGVAARQFWLAIRFAGIAMAPTAVFFFTTRYRTEFSRSSLILPLLLIEPIAISLLRWTNHLHGLFRRDAPLDAVAAVVQSGSGAGPALWLHILYSLMLVGIGGSLLLWKLLRRPELYRRHIFALVAGGALPLIAFLLLLVGGVDLLPLDPTPFATALSILLLAWAFYPNQTASMAPVAARQMAEGLEIGLLVVSEQREIVDVNPTAERLLRRPRQYLLGRDGVRGLAGIGPVLLTAIESRESTRQEILFIAGGHEAVLNVRAQPFEDRVTGARGCLLYLVDVTDESRRRRSLAESEEKFRQIFTHNPHPSWLCDLASMAILEVNEAAIRLYGYSRQEFLCSTLNRLASPSEVKEMNAEIRRSGAEPRYAGEWTHRLRDGQELAVELITSCLQVDGRRAALVVAEDITKRRRAEAFLARQASLAEIEKAIGGAAEVPDILKQIIEVVTADLPATAGASLLLWDEEQQAFLQSASTVAGQENGTVRNQVRKSGGASRWIIDEGKPLVVPNTRQDPFGANQMIEKHGIAAYAGVPLLDGDRPIGVIYALDNEPRHYSPQDINFLSTLANRAAMTVLRIRHTEVEVERRKLAETLRLMATTLNATLDLSEVISLVIDNLSSVVPYDFASVLLVQEGELTEMARRGAESPDALALMQQVLHGPFRAEMERTLQPISVPNVALDPRLQSASLIGTIRSWIGVPLVSRQQVIGMLTLCSERENAYTAQAVAIANTFGGQAAIAIENAHLFGTVQSMAITDSLTNLNNRRHFFQLGEYEFKRARRNARPMAVLMMDIDYFKRVNDTFGHAVGDQVLRTVADICLTIVREVDIPGRYGGEEFVVLLPESDLDGAHVVASRLREAVEDSPILTERGTVQVTISIGIAEISDRHEDLDVLLDEADQALYIAKMQGRNRVARYDGHHPSMAF